MSVTGTINYEAIDERLDGAAWNAYTQFGEDGLIEAVFMEIGIASGWCFEVGAADGLFFSNTLRLREDGWSAVLIESSEDQYQKLSGYESDKVTCIHETATDLDSTLARCNVPHDLDLGVIDIDGQDYWLWHDMESYRPRVMLVEFHWKDGESFIPPRGDLDDRRQAGPAAIQELGAIKGYSLVAKTHVNMLFVTEELWQSN